MLRLLSLGHSRFSRDWFVLRDGLDCILLQEHSDIEELLAHFARRAPAPELSLDDFPHLAADIELVVGALTGALASKSRGFHVLIHGPAGVGKTQLARAIAKALDCPLFEVAVESQDHQALDRDNRLAAFRVCQRYGERIPRSLVLFDEMEDAFHVSPFALFFGEDVPGEEKGFTNRLLEGTAIPTLWSTNRIRGVDPAFLRRFDLVVEVGAPPPPVRKCMLTRHLHGLDIDDALVSRISATTGVTPADCERAARVATLVGRTDGNSVDQIVTRVLDLRLKARGEQRLGTSLEAPAPYDLRYVNADVDLAALIKGLRTGRRGTVLLHGVPGTGKSALARHLSEALEMPLVARYGSDLLDKFVGQTEKAIAGMFEEAASQQGILFLDEADTFLGCRDAAQHRWEVSHTNELLVRMEGFDGIFLCATNRLAALDPACLRRFALKVEFKPLHADQALELFDATLRSAGRPVPAGEQRDRIQSSLRRLVAIAPGDFAAVWRRSRTFGLPLCAESLLSGIEAECRLKPAAGTSVGFVQ